MLLMKVFSWGSDHLNGFRHPILCLSERKLLVKKQMKVYYHIVLAMEHWYLQVGIILQEQQKEKRKKEKKSYMVLVSSKTIILQTISRMWTLSFHHFTRLLLLHHSRDLHCDLHCHSRDLHCQAEKNRQCIYYIWKYIYIYSEKKAWLITTLKYYRKFWKQIKAAFYMVQLPCMIMIIYFL